MYSIVTLRDIQRLKYFFIITLFIGNCLFGQKQSNFYKIDAKVESIPFMELDSLARALGSIGQTEMEKVRAMFRWITLNIDYSIRSQNRNRNSTNEIYEKTEDSLSPLPALDERIARKVLARRKAFCDGYSRLFKTLCEHAGIRSEIISGFARTNYRQNIKFGVNHIWNAVLVDNKWYLLDVTWASGFVSYTNNFIRSFNEYYFLTRPEDFIKDHYPDNLEWTLLNEPPVYREFRQSPFRYPGFVKSGVYNFYPLKGIIEVNLGDTVYFEINSIRSKGDIIISGIPLTDSALINTVQNQIPFSEKLTGYYIASSFDDEWLYVYCGEELIMRYKLNLRKDGLAVNKQEIEH